jgi:hypothetical protein
VPQTLACRRGSKQGIRRAKGSRSPPMSGCGISRPLRPKRGISAKTLSLVMAAPLSSNALLVPTPGGRYTSGCRRRGAQRPHVELALRAAQLKVWLAVDRAHCLKNSSSADALIKCTKGQRHTQHDRRHRCRVHQGEWRSSSGKGLKGDHSA